VFDTLVESTARLRDAASPHIYAANVPFIDSRRIVASQRIAEGDAGRD
jgi:hypothetical protein